SICLDSLVLSFNLFPNPIHKMPPTSSSINTPILSFIPSPIKKGTKKKTIDPSLAHLNIRPAPPKQPAQKSDASVDIVDTTVHTKEMMCMKILRDGATVGETQIDLKISERRINHRLHYHEFIAVDCYSGE
ncbi:hypothetical protein PENTCL1PPCAC_2813, partial [Pristionchus entomophagus]